MPSLRCPAAARLLAFKSKLYDPQQCMSTWRQGSNPCGPQPWAGLVCDDGWVVAVRLQDKGLNGPLTSDLLQLSHLVEVHLQNNQLTGEFTLHGPCLACFKHAAHACGKVLFNSPEGPTPGE